MTGLILFSILPYIVFTYLLSLVDVTRGNGTQSGLLFRSTLQLGNSHEMQGFTNVEQRAARTTERWVYNLLRSNKITN